MGAIFLGCKRIERCYLLPQWCQAAKTTKAAISGSEKEAKEQSWSKGPCGCSMRKFSSP